MSFLLPNKQCQSFKRKPAAYNMEFRHFFTFLDPDELTACLEWLATEITYYASTGTLNLLLLLLEYFPSENLAFFLHLFQKRTSGISDTDLYGPDAVSIIQPMLSKHWRKYITDPSNGITLSCLHPPQGSGRHGQGSHHAGSPYTWSHMYTFLYHKLPSQMSSDGQRMTKYILQDYVKHKRYQK